MLQVPSGFHAHSDQHVIACWGAAVAHGKRVVIRDIEQEASWFRSVGKDFHHLSRRRQPGTIKIPIKTPGVVWSFSTEAAALWIFTSDLGGVGFLESRRDRHGN